MCSMFAVLLAFAGAVAASLDEKRAASPTVTVKNGTIIGSTSSGIDSFVGIPFAQPPVGSLRLKPPQRITTSFGTITATSEPTACPQLLQTVNSTSLAASVIDLVIDVIGAVATNEGEDCLTLNVQRPSTATSSSELPVVVWIYGGAFDFGWTSMYSGDNIVDKSISKDQPIIYVEMNYRIGGFGFLAGKELQSDGSTNLGLRDQRLALEWVAENIASFGGDPSKVTLWGESAGAISVFDHTIINGGDNTYNGSALFRGAIMNSGSIVPADDVTTAKAQQTYDTVVANAGCSSANDSLECLRSVDYLTFLDSVNSISHGILSLNLTYLPRPDPADSFFSLSPEVSVLNGDYVKVPIIIGDQEDEGTLFNLSPTDVDGDDALIAYLESLFPNTNESVITGLVETYADNLSAGSPFRTGLLNEIYPGFKRVAAISGDLVFNLRRRQYLSAVSSTVNAWSFLDTHLYGTLVLGTFHASDLLEYYFDVTSAITEETYLSYYVSFINNLDPNAISTAAPLIDWPQYNTSSRSLVELTAYYNQLLDDTFRNTSFEYLQQYPTSFRV